MTTFQELKKRIWNKNCHHFPHSAFLSTFQLNNLFVIFYFSIFFYDMSSVPPVSLLVFQCLCLLTADISHFSWSIHAWPTSQRNKWVTLSFRVTPLTSSSALLNSLKQLDFVIKPRSHSQSHTLLLTHNVLFLATSHPPAAGGNIIQSLSCIYQQKGTIWWLPANQSFMSCWIPHASLAPSLSLYSLITES